MIADAITPSGRRSLQTFDRLKSRIRALEGAEAGGGLRLALGVPAIDAALTPDGRTGGPMGGPVEGQAGLPLGCLHELSGPFGDGACLGFSLWLAGRIAAQSGQSGQGGQGGLNSVLWVGCGAPPYPPGMAEFGLDPGLLVHIRPRKPADIPWVLEEAARTGAAPVVIGDLGLTREVAAGAVKGLDLTASRRLQLACEPFGTTLLLLASGSSTAAAGSAAAGRWRVESLSSRPSPLSRHSRTLRGRPGLGQPVWQVELLRARGGRPGSWPVIWQGVGGQGVGGPGVGGAGVGGPGAGEGLALLEPEETAEATTQPVLPEAANAA